jgi:hypothetical protein
MGKVLAQEVYLKSTAASQSPIWPSYAERRKSYQFSWNSLILYSRYENFMADLNFIGVSANVIMDRVIDLKRRWKGLLGHPHNCMSVSCLFVWSSASLCPANSLSCRVAHRYECYKSDLNVVKPSRSTRHGQPVTVNPSRSTRHGQPVTVKPSRSNRPLLSDVALTLIY